MKITLYLFLALAMLAGCSERKSGGFVSREVVDGVVVVKNPRDGRWQKRQEPPLRFILEKTFGRENEPERELFDFINQVVTDEQMNVYLFDVKANRIVKYDSAGNFIWETGREGQGPGEFQFVRGMVYNGRGRLYIANQLHRIDCFTLGGNYIKSFDLNRFNIHRFGIVGYITPNFLVGVEWKRGTAEQIYTIRMGDTLSLAGTFTIEEDIGITIPEGIGTSPYVSVLDSFIVAANIQGYVVSYYDIRGNLRRRVIRDFDKIVRPGILIEGNSRGIRGYCDLKPLKRLSGSYKLASAMWPDNLSDPDAHMKQERNGTAEELIYKNMIDLFSNEDELLYSLYGEGSIPEIGLIHHIDRSGRVYTVVSDPFPQVRRYRVLIDE